MPTHNDHRSYPGIFAYLQKRATVKRVLVLLTTLGAWSALGAQGPHIVTAEASPTIIVGQGWEAFPEVYYRGGDATQAKKRYGMLVLTDSTLALYECTVSYCGSDEKKSMIRGRAFWEIRLTSIKEISASTLFKGTSMGSKFMLGALAGDGSEELVGVVYETDASAEAPVFKTRKAQAAAIEAKLKFRLKKLGIAAPLSPPVD